MSVARTFKDKMLARSSKGDAPCGLKLPPDEYRMGGKHFRDNDAFVARAKDDVEKLRRHGLGGDSRILDWGCGAGRLAIGLRETWPAFSTYLGVDVQRNLIAWAQRNLAGGGIVFTLADAANARYNPDGTAAHSIPADTASFDALYGYSVLSHMTSAEVVGYLAEIRRVLADDGFAWVTAFVEPDVPDEEENPAGYGPLEWVGPLHCVRFDRDYFEGLVNAAGLRMSSEEHGAETDGQTALVLRPAV